MPENNREDPKEEEGKSHGVRQASVELGMRPDRENIFIYIPTYSLQIGYVIIPSSYFLNLHATMSARLYIIYGMLLYNIIHSLILM